MKRVNSKNRLIAGLDIGSTDIRLVIGNEVPTESGDKLEIFGAVSVPAAGISRGVINSIEDATSAISACLEKAERLLRVTVTDVYIGINGPNLKCERSKGVVAISRGDGEITADDITRALEAAEAVSVPPNYEILHVMPVSYKVDNQEQVKNPLGMTGVRLEVEALVIQALSSQIKNLTRAIDRANLHLEDLVFSPLAAASIALDDKQRELGVALVNMGATTTSVAIYEEGELLHTAVLPIGASHITNDIAIGLRCPITLAERIKVRYGSAKAEKFTKKDEIDITDILHEEGLEDENSIISQHYVAEIIQARVEEILERVDAEFKKINRSGLLPAGVVLTGGGAKLTDIVEISKKILKLPVTLGGNKQAATRHDKANDPEYLTASGLVVWGDINLKQSSRHTGGFGLGSDLGGGIKKLFSIFKS
ncbi:MAG: cell division protein FtsA [Candidatus Falkowbacteria bacterium]